MGGELKREDFVRWGRAGGKKSRRTLTREEARRMLLARARKRAERARQRGAPPGPDKERGGT